MILKRTVLLLNRLKLSNNVAILVPVFVFLAQVAALKAPLKSVSVA